MDRTQFRLAPKAPEDALLIAHIETPVPVATESLRFLGSQLFEPNNISGRIPQSFSTQIKTQTASVGANLVGAPTFRGTIPTLPWAPGSTSGNSTNFLQNPGFETHDDYFGQPDFPLWWMINNYTGLGQLSAKRTSASAHTGSFCMQLYTIYDTAAIFQTVRIPAKGQPITLSVWAKQQTPGNTEHFKLRMDLVQVATPSSNSQKGHYQTAVLATQSSTNITPANAWTQYTLTWTPPVIAGGDYLQVTFVQDNASGTVTNSILLDDAFLGLSSGTSLDTTTTYITGWTPREVGQATIVNLLSNTTDSTLLIEPIFSNIGHGVSDSFSLESAPFTVAPATNYVYKTRIYTTSTFPTPNCWVNAPLDSNGNVFTPNITDFATSIAGINASNVPVSFPVNVVFQPGVVNNYGAAAYHIDLLTPDPRYPNYLYYELTFGPFVFDASVTHANITFNMAFTNGIKLGSTQFGTVSTLTQTVTGTGSIGSRVQNQIAVDDIYVDQTNAWRPRIRDGVFQKPFTLTTAEPSGSWLRQVGFSNGDNLQLIYTLPEYDFQPSTQPLIHALHEQSALCSVLDAFTILLPRRPLINLESLFADGVNITAQVTQSDVATGKIHLSIPIQEDAVVTATFTYREDRYVYTGYKDDAGVWHDLDLNPTAGHICNFGVDNVGVSSSTLLDQGVTLYLMPSAAYIPSASGLVRPNSIYQATTVPRSLVRHVIGTENTDALIASMPSSVLLAKIFYRSGPGVEGVSVLDLRERGGGYDEVVDTGSLFEESRRYTMTVPSAHVDTGLQILPGDLIELQTWGDYYDLSYTHSWTPPVTLSLNSGSTQTLTKGNSWRSPAAGLLALDTPGSSGSFVAGVTIIRPQKQGVNWDLTNWDGNPLPPGTAIVTIPGEVLNGTDGFPKFTTDQVHQTVNKHIAAGIAPLVRYRPPSTESQFTLSLTGTQWADTGLDVLPNQELIINAQGLSYYNGVPVRPGSVPPGYTPGSQTYGIVAGSFPSSLTNYDFVFGRSYQAHPPRSGRLYLRYEGPVSNQGLNYFLGNLIPSHGYTLRLWFIEPVFNSANLRQFNVTVNGSSILTNYDPYTAGGGKYKPSVYSFNATSDSTGQFNIVFSAPVGITPAIAGIDITSTSTLSITDNNTAYHINCGGGNVTGYSGDFGAHGGFAQDFTGQIPVLDLSSFSMPPPAALFNTLRMDGSGQFTYNFQLQSPL